MNVSVTGWEGQVGTELLALGAEAVDGDICTVEKVDADALIHCAALTDVDGCELDPGEAMRVNADGTKHLVDVTDAFVVYVSTDYVFDGTKPSPYVETDTPNPINAYGRSKLEGEHAIDTSRHAIVRTSWVNGRVGNNIVRTILRRLDDEQPLRS